MYIEAIHAGYTAVQPRWEPLPIFLNNANSAKTESIRAEQESRTATPEEVSKVLEQLRKSGDMFGRKLQFRVNEKLNRIIVKVIDTDTEKVIREIPSEEIQRLQERIKEMAGLLFDETI